jgi:hypothetical protein
VLAGACSGGGVSSSAPIATATMTPSPVPGLGNLSLATFPSTPGGEAALALCETWARLRGQYVGAIRSDSPRQLDVWFSAPAWEPAFFAQQQIEDDPAYSQISAAFGLATAPDIASIADAETLDAACAAGD